MDNCTCISRERVSIVYGNDFTIEAHVSVYDKDEGIYKLLDLTGVKECQMRLVGTYRKAIGKDITVTGSKVTGFFPGGSVGVGTYGVEITFVDSLGKGRIFERNLIGIVSASGDATVDNIIEGETGEGLNVTVNVLTRTVRIGDSGSVLSDYNLLENRPSIGGVTLEGNKRPSDLGMYSKEEADGKFETKSHAADTFQTKESAAEADKRVQGMLDGKVDKEPGKGLSANDLTDERAGKVDMLAKDGRANEHLNGAGTYSRPVRQGYGVSVADDNTVSVDPQVIARQSDVASVAADLDAQKAKEQGDIDRANAAISKEETDRKAAVTALQSLIDILNSGYQFMGVATPETNPSTPDQKVFYIANGKGVYANFGGIEVAEGEVVILYYDTAWHKVATGIASEADAILGMAHGDKVNVPLEFVTDGRLTEKGTISSSSGSKVTDFIAIDSRNKYYLSNYIYANYDNGVCYYSDANEDSFIGSQFNANDLGNVGLKILAETELAVPINARYVRIGTRNVTYTNATILLVSYAKESMSMLSAKRIESRLNQQENAINALYPYIEHSDSVNVFDKNNVEIIHKYISSKNIILDNDISVLSHLIIKIEDCDGVNNTYIFKYLGTSDVMAEPPS